MYFKSASSGVDLHHINALEEEYQYLENKLQEQRKHPDTRDGLKVFSC
jgi:hypothetical protein